MIIEDFICLGRTVPEESKTYGHRVCMAGYSEELGKAGASPFVRVYPLMVENPIHARCRCVLDLERNEKDSRRESWKLKHPTRGVVKVCEEVSIEATRKFLKRQVADSIASLNQNRLSLGVLHVDARGSFVARKEASHPDQLAFFDDLDSSTFGAKAVDLAPYLAFRDGDGTDRKIQLREWGSYEWIRKHRDDAASLWSNLQVHSPDPTLIVVGNMNNIRTSWLVIKTYKAKVEAQTPLFAEIS
jgi:hypothetical protein